MAKILVVDDEVDIRRILTKRFKQAGHEVITASEGYSAIESANKEKPDLIILDLMLPVGDGVTVLNNLRISRVTDSIPVIVLTGSTSSEYRKKIQDLGVDAFLTKPYEAEKLLAIIDKLVAH